MADFQSKLRASVSKNNSLLCVGLDSNPATLPTHLADQPEPILAFNKTIIDATADLVCAFKPNSAFYEGAGADGIAQLQKTCQYILKTYPNVPVILDAKRADIGSTNEGYVQFAFEYLSVDAITLQPYLGREALEPFLARVDKGLIILCHTTNPGAGELQDLQLGAEKLYQTVARKVRDEWNKNDNCLLVAGAAYPEELADIRRIVGDNMWFLVPGIGAQGGDVEATVKAGLNSDGDGLIINSSRDIIFASSGPDFAEAARAKAQATRDEINKYRS
jgi:orotidine-5'-phosphate decarboxylase